MEFITIGVHRRSDLTVSRTMKNSCIYYNDPRRHPFASFANFHLQEALSLEIHCFLIQAGHCFLIQAVQYHTKRDVSSADRM
jgi:hypothetical protein